MDDNASYIELSELQELIRERIGLIELWVRVEIESHREVNGHHYLNVLEKTSEGEIAARASARIWRSNSYLVDYFTKVTGKELQTGLSIVVKVSVDYHAQYGLALNITDIDCSYSIGQRELEKKETIRRLIESGLIDRQKELKLPYLPSSIAVISSRDAAGYGDFMKHIATNSMGFRYDCTLFHSLMQGQNAPSMIIDRLNEIKAAGRFNVVLILRGGGAESDMFCFDDYELCRTIAEFPLPVLTAIGHERDFHIADMVAHDFYKTPTALADSIIEWTQDVESQVSEVLASVVNALKDRLSDEESRISAILSDIRYRLLDRINSMSVEPIVSTIQFAISSSLNICDMNVAMLQASIQSADPRGILKQGYVLAVDKDGNILKNVRSGRKGDDFSLRFSEGLWNCTINNVKTYN